MLAANELWWQPVMQRLEDESLFEFANEDPSIAHALTIGLVAVGEAALRAEPRVRPVLESPNRRTELFMSLVIGYGVGRMALGTEGRSFVHSTTQDVATSVGTEIAQRAAEFDVDDVINCAAQGEA